MGVIVKENYVRSVVYHMLVGRDPSVPEDGEWIACSCVLWDVSIPVCGYVIFELFKDAPVYVCSSFVMSSHIEIVS